VDDPTEPSATAAGEETSADVLPLDMDDAPGPLAEPSTPAAPSQAPEATPTPSYESVTAWLLRRVDAIKEAGGIANVKRRWPEGAPSPKAVRDGDAIWTELDIGAVTVAIVKAADDTGLPDDDDHPFGPPDPSRLAGSRPATKDEAADIRRQFGELSKEHQNAVREWIEQGKKIGKPWAFLRTPTAERIRKGQAAILLAAMDDDDVRAAYLDTAIPGDGLTGQRIARMTHGEAGHFIDVLDKGALTFGDDGKPVVSYTMEVN
jgi:hypothetical protein